MGVHGLLCPLAVMKCCLCSCKRIPKPSVGEAPQHCCTMQRWEMQAPCRHGMQLVAVRVFNSVLCAKLPWQLSLKRDKHCSRSGSFLHFCWVVVK
eukprot:2100174-Amphidinium_carterae.1